MVQPALHSWDWCVVKRSPHEQALMCLACESVVGIAVPTINCSSLRCTIGVGTKANPSSGSSYS